MRCIICILLISLFLFTATSANGQEDPDSLADYMVEAFVTNDNPFVGEQIEYVFRFRASQRPPDLTDELPGFDGFWLVDIPNPGELGVETIGGRQFFVGERRVVLSPMQEGIITIEAATLVLPETVFREGARYSTDPITIAVQPLPASSIGVFTGAVGQFHADTTIDRTTVTLGQPIALSMVVTGTGNLASLQAPNLDFPDEWRVYTNPTRYSTSNVSGLRVGEKVFEWLVISERTGSMMFPEVAFVFFNPQTGEYHSLVEESVTINVLPDASRQNELRIYEPEVVDLPPLSIMPLPTKLDSASSNPGMILWVLWILMPLLPAASAGWIYGNRYQMHRQLVARRTTALQRASKRLRLAQKKRRPQASDQIVQAIQGYLADKSGFSMRLFKEKPISAILSEGEVASDVAVDLQEILKQAEAMRYIPAHFEADVPRVIKEARATLAQLDATWTTP